MMNDKNLIIYKFNSLYHILEELSSNLNFNIICVESENHLGDITVKLDHFLIISNKKYKNIGYQFILENLPISIFKLIEKINIELFFFFGIYYLLYILYLRLIINFFTSCIVNFDIGFFYIYR